MLTTALPWVEPSAPTLWAFLAIVGFVVGAFVFAVAHASAAHRARNTGLAIVGVFAWMGLAAAVSGQLEAALPVSLYVFFGGSNLSMVALGLSPLGKRLAVGTPLVVLLAFPAFRFPLELVLHRWAEAGVVPPSMTWTGQNIDILAGVIGPLTAFVVWRLPQRARVIGLIGNTLCFLLLLNVGRVAMLSSPGPQNLLADPPLVLAFHVPTVWIVSVCVGGALLGHIVTFRKLLDRSTTRDLTSGRAASGRA